MTIIANPLAANVPLVNSDGTPTPLFMRIWQETVLSAVTPQVVQDSDLVMNATAINNATARKHGFLPQLPNSSTLFLNGLGAWATPAGGGGSGNPLVGWFV